MLRAESRIIMTTSKRPMVLGVPKPLAATDPVEWWEEEAHRLGLPVADLREQVRLADEILTELFAEERDEGQRS